MAKRRIEPLDDNTQPVHSATYRAEPKTLELGKIKIDKMLKDNITEPAETEWAAPIVFAPKKDDSLRFCDDYRRLHAVKKQDPYSIPRMNKCNEPLGDVAIFSTLDTNSGYSKAAIYEADRDKTALTSHHA